MYLAYFTCVCGEATDNIVVSNTKQDIYKAISKLDEEIDQLGGEGCGTPDIYEVEFDKYVQLSDCSQIIILGGLSFYFLQDNDVLSDTLKLNVPYCLFEEDTGIYLNKVKIRV